MAPVTNGSAGTLSVVGISGYKGDTPVAQSSGDTFEYSEDVFVRFSATLQPGSVAYSIAPQTASTVSVNGGGARISLRKIPGTNYTVTITAATSQAGAALAQSFTMTLTTALVTMPPLAVPAPSPYRIGVLEHPWSPFLVGSYEQQQLQFLQQSGVGYVRIDYQGYKLEPTPGVFDFSQSDTIADTLAAQGITELPVLLQYSPPGWANNNAPYPATWTSPSDFAAFAGGVAAHLRVREPQITRIEIFNEPNLGYWWSNANPAFSSRSGNATAAYMQAAYAAIKAANPALVVVGPALADGGTSFVDPRTFLSAMYGAGCRTGTCWDVLSVHEYAWTDPASAVNGVTHASSAARLDVYKDLQSIATSNGDPQPHVMITEWGYTTDTTTTAPLGVDPAVQALYVSKVLSMFAADPTIDGSTYVNVFIPGTDYWSYTGLVTPTGSVQPALAVVRQFSAH